MPETPRIIRVFVSSPGDVQCERALMDDVAKAINRSDGQAGGYRIELFKWEDDVVPQIGPEPQAVVDGQTPAYDVYLGIMSTRLGGGGTTQEFRDALQNWEKTGSPWIIFYFNDAPQLSRDPAEVLKYAEVCEFREQLEQKGIVFGYSGERGTDNAFYDRVCEHLRGIARRLGLGETGQPGKPTIPAEYIEWLQRECADISLLGLQVQQGQAVKLNHVYVPLTTYRDDAREGPGEPGQRTPGEDEQERIQLLLELIDRQSLYVSGAPGSGKSTFCRWVAWLTCEGAMPPAEAPPPENYQETFPRQLAGRLPLLIRLRDFWSHLPQTAGCREMSRSELEATIAQWIDAKQQGGLTAACARAHLANGSLLLIFDGMDEVPLTHGDARRPCEPRAMLLSGLKAALDPWLRQGNRVLLTSRPYGMSDQEARALNLRQAPLRDLDPPVREFLVQKWFRCLTDEPQVAADAAAEMLRDVTQRRDIEPLTANPMLLTAACIIYHQGRRLPEDRYDLYHCIVNNVLFNRFPEDRQVVDPVRNRLAVVAHGMHTGTGLGEERREPQAEATYAEIDRMIQVYQDQTAWTEPGYEGAVEAREQLLSRTGLLLPRDDDRAGFYHLTIQDFLAAQRLLDLEEANLQSVFRTRADVPGWRSTLSFVFGSQLAKHSSPQRSIGLLSGLIDALQENSLGLGVVVAECLQILIRSGVRLSEEPEQKLRQFSLAAIEREVPAAERCELALALGQLGDPRIVADLRDQGDYVEIPTGQYQFGDEKQPLTIDQPFYLSRYPVTNSQYALFIEDGGYATRACWSDEGWQWRESEAVEEPRFWRDGKWNGANQPVVGVSYWEAEAFCRWAGGCLPSEQQWEAAARGPEGHKYPWGEDWEDGICNSRELRLGVTSPVGIFPRSQSVSSGLDDMAGNVWEWCSDLYDPERYGASYRVFRGGSWAYVADGCCAAYRRRLGPSRRDEFLGFRVARVPLAGRAGPGRQAEPGA